MKYLCNCGKSIAECAYCASKYSDKLQQEARLSAHTKRRIAELADSLARKERGNMTLPYTPPEVTGPDEIDPQKLDLTWTRIFPYGDESEMTYWISGIYKVVSYGSFHEFYAYFLPEGNQNWGDRVGDPPINNGAGNRCWPSLKDAQSACGMHSETHIASTKTIKRAEQIKHGLLIQEEEAFAGRLGTTEDDRSAFEDGCR